MYMWNLKYERNELIYETDSQTRRTDLFPKVEGAGDGWIGSLGLAYADSYIQNGLTTESYSLAQRTIFNVL